MSRRYDIINDIAKWCAKRELPQIEVIELVHWVLDDAGQSDYDRDEDSEVEKEIESIKSDVAKIYERVLGYSSNESKNL